MKNPKVNHNSWSLDCGVTVQLDELVQWRTYSGWMAGYPDKQVNRNKIERAKITAAAKISSSDPVCLIKPRSITVSHIRPSGEIKKYPRLPLITCAALLISSAAAKDANKCFSTLMVLWFQEEWALPINPAVLKKIKGLSWSELAADYDF